MDTIIKELIKLGKNGLIISTIIVAITFIVKKIIDYVFRKETEKNLFLLNIKNRIVPEVENISSILLEYRILNNTRYLKIISKDDDIYDLEQKRVELDKKILFSINAIQIYFGKETRFYLNKIRNIISISFKNPKTTNKAINSYWSELEINKNKSFPINEIINYVDARYNYEFNNILILLNAMITKYYSIQKIDDLAKSLWNKEIDRKSINIDQFSFYYEMSKIYFFTDVGFRPKIDKDEIYKVEY